MYIMTPNINISPNAIYLLSITCIVIYIPASINPPASSFFQLLFKRNLKLKNPSQYFKYSIVTSDSAISELITAPVLIKLGISKKLKIKFAIEPAIKYFELLPLYPAGV